MVQDKMDPARLAGGNNVLWRRAEDLIPNSPARVEELSGHLAAIPDKDWQQVFGSGFTGQAKALGAGTLNVALAVGEWTQGNRHDFFRHLSDGCRDFQSAFDASRPLPHPASPPDLAHVSAEDLPRRCLRHLESKNCWGRDPPGYFPGLGMARSALAELLPKVANAPQVLPFPAQPVWHTHLPLLFVPEGNRGEGVVKSLTLEWFQQPGDTLYFFPDPKALGCTTLDPEFRRSLQNTWEYIRKKAPKEFLQNAWVRWRIEVLSVGERRLGGGSAGGAFAASLWGLAYKRRFDRVGLTATVDKDGNLGPVAEIEAKLAGLVHEDAKLRDTRWEDLIRSHLLPTFVISSTGYQRFLTDSRRQSVSSLRIYGAATVDDALPILLGQAEEVLDYLQRIRDRASQDPLIKLLPVGFQKREFFENLHVQVRVSSQRRDPQSDREQERRRNAGLPAMEEDDQFGKTAYRHAADDSHFMDREHAEPPIPWHDQQASNRCARSEYLWAAILGDPGLGKSTLLRYEAWLTAGEQIARLQSGDIGVAHVVMPFYLRLDDLAGIACQQPMDRALVDLLTDPQRGGLVAQSEQLRTLIRRKLCDGQVVLLLDSFDEVPEQRYEVLVRWIRGWTENYPAKRLYLASRIVGYRGLPFIPKARASTDRFWRGELELVALRQDDIQHYIRGVFGGVTDPQSGLPLEATLCNHLKQNPSLMGLAQAPLLLSLICFAFVHGLPRRPPPETRCQLFRECLDGLLGRWPHVRRAETDELSEHECEQLDLKLQLLGQIAWRICSDDPERTLFPAKYVKDALQHERCQPLLEQIGWTPETARHELAQTHGIFVRIGSGRDARYLFLHRSLQEYLLARVLARRSNWLQESLSHVYDPAWTEVLGLLGGVLCQEAEEAGERNENRCVEYIQGLLKKNAEDLLRRPLLLAGRAANEAPCLPDKLANGLARNLVVFFLRPSVLIRGERLVAHLMTRKIATYSALLVMLKDGEFDVRRASVDALGRIGSGCPEVVSALLQAAGEHRWSTYGTHEARALGRLAQASPAVVSALVQALRGQQPEIIRSTAVAALGHVGQASPEAVAALVEALRDRDLGPRLRAAEALGQIGEASPEVVAALVAAFQNDNSWAAAYALGDLGQKVPEVVDALVETLRKYWDNRSGCFAARALGRLSHASPEVVDALVQTLVWRHDCPWDDEGEFDVRYEAAYALRRLGQDCPQIAAALVQALGDGDSAVRFYAAQACGPWAIPEAVEMLLRASRYDYSYIRAEALFALAGIGQASAEVVAAFVQALGDPERSVRKAAVRALFRFDEASAEVLAALVDALRDQDPEVRSAAAQELGRLGHGSADVVAALEQSSRDEVSYVRTAATHALGQLAQASANAIVALEQALRHEDPSVRNTAAVALGRLIRKPIAVGDAHPTYRKSHEQLQAEIRVLLDETEQLAQAQAPLRVEMP